MDLIHHGLYFIRHLDLYLNSIASEHQIGVYALLMTIIFCETGLVIFPMLPGDTLLFALGSLAASPNSPINLPLVMVLLCLAANCGDILNYTIGYRIGPKIFSRQSSWLLNRKHLEEAHRFYAKHGRKTIIMARFIAFVRTFAPFVAGIGKMPFSRFIGFSISGGVLWVLSLSMAGFYFGRIQVVHDHFELVVLGIIVVSAAPVLLQTLRRKDSGAVTLSAVPSVPASDQAPRG